MNLKTPVEYNDAMFRAKAERRRQLAELPFDEKVEIVVKLQQIAYELTAASGRPARKPWAVPYEPE